MRTRLPKLGHSSVLALLALGLATPVLGQGDVLVVPEKQVAPPAMPAAAPDFIWQEGMRALEEAARRAALPRGEEAAGDVGNAFGEPAAVAKTTGFNCLPSCSSTDAKFLAIAGSNLVTLSDPVLEFGIAIPAGATSFELGVFDGDGAELDESGANRWDIGDPAIYTFRLFADPLADGEGSLPVEWLPGVTVLTSDTMPNDAWIDFSIPTSVEAQAPSGNFFYRLEVELTSPTVTTLNAFKLRSNAVVTSIEPFSQPFSYIATISSFEDAAVLFPDFPASATCTPDATRDCYDGRFTFFFDLPVELAELDIWDGDFDRGNYDGTEPDLDDPDTPGSPFLPPWATGDALFEGVASGIAPSTGNPPDNTDPAIGLGAFALREPAVRWDLFFPDGRIFPNDNPSGNQEWEKFTVSTAPFDRLLMDFSTPEMIPAGIYRMTVEGVDLQNLNAILLPYRILCADVLGNACIPLRPFEVGDVVFEDSNGNGLREDGEPGIADVVLNLVSPASGAVFATTVTDSEGLYSFPVDRGSFGVAVDSSNFEPGGALEGLVSTSGGDQIDDTVVNDNVLTYDFGYGADGASIGDFVWLDQNGDGVQDPDEPGLDGVRIQLFNSEGGLIDETLTADGGLYEFTGLNPDTYTVLVDDSTLPDGVVETFDFDGIDSPHEVIVDIAEGEANTAIDFGYRSSAGGVIGDFVWNDANGDGIQDPDEPGIDEVTVQLFDSEGELVDVTVTEEGGLYEFTGLSPDVYTVVVVQSTLPADLVPTFDLDGAEETPFETEVELGPDEELFEVDFGFGSSANSVIGDFVWNDANGDGVQDAGEAGLDGVTVELYNSEGGLVASTVTEEGGLYEFTDLTADTYTVLVVEATLPPDFVQTFDRDGLGTPNTAVVSVGVGEEARDVDFGYVEQASGALGDLVWLDSNGDGVQDPGEPGIDGVSVRLFDAGGTLVATVVTEEGGLYEFTDLRADTYTVSVDPATVPAGLVPTFDFDGIGTPNTATVTLVAGDFNRDVDFGYREPRGSIGDRVWLDSNGDGIQDPGEQGLNGVRLDLIDAGGEVIASAITTGDGAYGFANLAGGTYTVRVDPSTILFGNEPTFDFDGIGTANLATLQLGESENQEGVDFGYTGDGDVCVERALKDGAVAKGSGGHALWMPGIGEDFVFVPSPGWLEFRADGTARMSGTFRRLADAAQGFEVEAILTGYQAIPPAGSPKLELKDAAYVDNGGPIDPATWFYFTDWTGTLTGIDALAGAILELRDVGASLQVGFGASGKNTNFGLASWLKWTVIQQPTNGPSLPDNKRGDINMDIVDCPTDGALGGRVWDDADRDGTQDGGEAGLASTTVTLLDGAGNAIGTATTDADGHFLFAGLPAGAYSIVVDPPAGTDQTFDPDGTLDSRTSLALGPGETRLGVDFGYTAMDGGGGSVCLPTFDFETDGAGAPLVAGQILDDEWSALGVTVTTHDPVRHPAMIFDSGNPTGGDPDLGTPNRDFGGPGRGDGGRAGRPGENSEALGHVVIISEDADSSDPDDNTRGGTLIFTFEQAVFLDSIGILDIDEGKAGEVRAYDDGGTMLVAEAMSDILGNNSVQSVFLGVEGVHRLEVFFPGSGAVTDIVFCPGDGGGSGGEPSVCLSKVDFESDASGNELVAGQIIDDEWSALGVTVTTHDPSDHPAMIFDSGNPTGGDADLGTPNQDFGGPGKGRGGRQGRPGENSRALGKVLIISEDGDSSDPDDNGRGGTLIFTFDQPVFLDSVGILDIDEGKAGTVTAFGADGSMIISQGMSGVLGDNSVQTVTLDVSGVRRLEISFPGSGAVTDLVFCTEDGGEGDGGNPGDGVEEPIISAAMIYPNGGEALLIGSRQEILWEPSYFHDRNVKLELSRDGGATFETLSGRTKNDGSHKWTVIGAPSDQMVIRVSDHADPALFDENDAPFTVPAPVLSLTSPAGGDSWIVGSRRSIEWQTENLEGNVKLELSRDGGHTFETLAKNTKNDGSHKWTVDAPADSMVVRVTSRAAPEVVAESAPFTVPVPSLELLSPRGGEVWHVGNKYAVEWRTENLATKVRIELSRDGGQTFDQIHKGTRDDGSFTWKAEEAAADLMMRISSTFLPELADQSASTFSVEMPTVDVVAPVAGAVWKVKRHHDIRWSAENMAGNVRIELSRNGGQSWERVSGNTRNDGSFRWKVRGQTTDRAMIRVSSRDHPSLSESSPLFAIEN